MKTISSYSKLFWRSVTLSPSATPGPFAGVCLLLATLAGTFVCFRAAEAQEQPVKLEEQLGRLKTAQPNEYNAIIQEILSNEPEQQAIVNAISNGVSHLPDDRKSKLVAGWSEWTATDSKGVTRPYQLFLPKSIASGEKPAAVIVHLHGAVGKPEFGTGAGSPAATGYAGFLWPKVVEEENIAVVCPVGRDECAWWTDNGVAHVDAVLRDIHRSLEVPVESIFAAGFSDGGSGCYYRAMAAPDPFAGFFAMNGHPRVASSASGKQLYLPNLAATTTIAAMTQEDTLYPSKSVMPHIAKALQFDADVYTISYPNVNHQPLYFEDQTKTILKFLKNTKRENRGQLRWYTSDPARGKVDWLEITGIIDSHDKDSKGQSKDETNVMSVRERVRIGIRFARSEKVEVAEVVEKSVAESAGIKQGDALTEFDGQVIADVRSFRKLLARKSEGDSFTCNVKRGNEEIELNGNFPPFVAKPIYYRDKPTAVATCRIETGEEPRIVVDCTNVRSLRIWLPDELAKLDKINVVVNGKAAMTRVQKLSAEQTLSRYAQTADSHALRTAFIEISN